MKYHSADPDTVLLWGDQDTKDWRVFLREEGQGVRMFWNANRSQWWEGFHERCVSDGIGCDFNLPSVCGEYINLYCADQILGLDIVTLSKDGLLTGQEQACTRITWLSFVRSFVTKPKMAEYTEK